MKKNLALVLAGLMAVSMLHAFPVMAEDAGGLDDLIAAAKEE